LTTPNLPPYTPSGSIANGAITFANAKNTSNATGAAGAITTGPAAATNDFTSLLNPSQATTTFTGSAQGGSSTPFSLLQPTMLMTIYIKL
jgi:hypothetical protein